MKKIKRQIDWQVHVQARKMAANKVAFISLREMADVVWGQSGIWVRNTILDFVDNSL